MNTTGSTLVNTTISQFSIQVTCAVASTEMQQQKKNTIVVVSLLAWTYLAHEIRSFDVSKTMQSETEYAKKNTLENDPFGGNRQKVSTKQPLTVPSLLGRGVTNVSLGESVDQGSTRTSVLMKKPRPFSNSSFVFHVIHTTDERSFGKLQKRCLESIFFHHPNAVVSVHAKNLTLQTFQYLIDAGYHLEVKPLNLRQSLKQLQSTDAVSPELITNFIDQIDNYASDPKGYWYVNEADMLRLLIMYLEGGMYIGKSPEIALVKNVCQTQRFCCCLETLIRLL